MSAAKNNWSALFKKEQPQNNTRHDDQNNDKRIVEEKLNELRSKCKDPEFAKKVATLLGEWK